MLKTLYLSLFLFTGFVLSGQSKLDEAREDLSKLKKGVLLVRLQTQENKIEALEKLKRPKEAEKIRQEQYLENREIILSFSNIFTFCPVYFFYAGASQDIRQGNFEDVLFDSNLQKVPATVVKGHYYTAEFSETENLGIDGLIIMDKKMIPLTAPFPFYQRKYIFFGLVSLSKGKIIERLNNKLWDTYYLWFPEERPDNGE